MKPADQNHDDEHETLVSYLDGELDHAQTVEVENRLASDPEYRSQLQGLEKTWDMLDVLPAVEPTNSFTRSTLELVINDAKAALRKKRSSRWSSVLKVATLIIVPCICYFATAGIINWRNQAPINQLVEDVPFLQKYELYETIGKLKFAELLNEQKLLADIEMDGSEGTVEKFVWEPSPAVLENLSNDERGDLRRAKLRYETLTEPEQKALRTTHETLLARDDRDELLSTMQQFQIWSSERTYSNSQSREVVNSISDMQPNDAVNKVKELLKSARQSMASSSIPTADKDIVFKWFDRLIAENEQKIHDRIVELKDRQGRMARSLSRISAEQPSDVLTWILIRFDHEFVMNLISDEKLEELIESVSGFSKRLITGKANADEQRRFIVMMNSQIYVSQQKLREFYDNELSDEERKQLEGLTGEQLREEVRKKYIGRRFQSRSNGNQGN